MRSSMEQVKRKSEEQIKDQKAKESSVVGENSSKSESTEKNLKTKTSLSEQDLDSFLLGDLEDSDGGPVTKLVGGDSSRKIVAIICQTTWLKGENHSGRERVLKVHNTQKL